MWQAPNQRVRAAANARKRERERARKPIHIKRIRALIEIVSGSQKGASNEVRMIVNDLSASGIGIFAPIQLSTDQEIILKFEDPTPIDIRARVAWSQDIITNSHIISAQPYTYRIGLEFLSSSPEEQQNIKTFCEDLLKNYIQPKKAA
jgi:hypothetical protein